MSTDGRPDFDELHEICTQQIRFLRMAEKTFREGGDQDQLFEDVLNVATGAVTSLQNMGKIQNVLVEANEQLVELIEDVAEDGGIDVDKHETAVEQLEVIREMME